MSLMHTPTFLPHNAFSCPACCIFAVCKGDLLSVVLNESGLACWVCRLLRKVVGARELWPTGSWQRPKRWPARSPRLRDLIPGKHPTHVCLAVCVGCISKHTFGPRLRGLTRGKHTLLVCLAACVGIVSRDCVRSKTEGPEPRQASHHCLPCSLCWAHQQACISYLSFA